MIRSCNSSWHLASQCLGKDLLEERFLFIQRYPVVAFRMSAITEYKRRKGGAGTRQGGLPRMLVVIYRCECNSHITHIGVFLFTGAPG